MERRFGFRAPRPLEGAGGRERFGMIERTGGGFAAILSLRAETGSPPPPAALHAMLDRLAGALPECPVQFLLSRRPVDGTSLLAHWRAGIESRLGASPAAARTWDMLAGSYLPRLEAAGVCDLWCGIAVGGADIDELAGRVAGLYISLPYEAKPATADELGALIGRLLRSDTTSGYWQVTTPMPAGEGGLLRRLLQFPDLLSYSFDLAIHLRPATTERDLRAVLDDRLLRLETELRHRGGPPASAPPPGGPPDLAGRWLLELERREVAERREALVAGRERLREAVVMLALHAPADGPESRTGEAATAFDHALSDAEITAHRMHGRVALGRAARALLPLADAVGIRGFPLPTHQAVELALLPTPPRPTLSAPILGLTPEKTLFTYGGPGAPVPHLLVAGGASHARRAAARQWAVQSYLGGDDILIWDADGADFGFVEGLGGRYIRPGGPLPADGIDLPAVPLPELNRPEFFELWLREVSGLLGLLLAPLTGQDADAAGSQVSSALLQIAIRCLEQKDAGLLNLDALYDKLRAGGYQVTADGVERLAAGPARNLFSPAVYAGEAPGIIALGPSDPALGSEEAQRLAAQIAFRHALWPDSRLFGVAARRDRRRIVLVDGLLSALGNAPLAADLVSLAQTRPPSPSLWLILADGELDQLAADPDGRALLLSASLTFIFGPASRAVPVGSAPDPGVAALLALRDISLTDQLPLLSPDQALVQAGGQTWVLEIANA
ncbi:MAG: hypothetical protein ACR2M0_14680 [Chloroflexia bacterium]